MGTVQPVIVKCCQAWPEPHLTVTEVSLMTSAVHSTLLLLFHGRQTLLLTASAVDLRVFAIMCFYMRYMAFSSEVVYRYYRLMSLPNQVESDITSFTEHECG